MRPRSITSASSAVPKPGTLWPPPRIATAKPSARAAFTAAMTSATPVHRTTTAGRLSIIALYTLRASSYRPSFGRMTSPRTDPFSSVATFSDIIGTLPLAGTIGYRRNFFNAFPVDDVLSLDPPPDKAVNELGPKHHFPIQRNLHRGHAGETLEGVVLRCHVAQTVGPAEQVFLWGVLRLMYQFGVAEHTLHVRKGCVPRDHEMVDDFAGVFQEPKTRDHVDRSLRIIPLRCFRTVFGLSPVDEASLSTGARGSSIKTSSTLQSRLDNSPLQSGSATPCQLGSRPRNRLSVATARSTSRGQTSSVKPPSTFHAIHATSGAPSAFTASSRLQSPSNDTRRSSLPKTAGTIRTQYPCTIPRSSRRRTRSRTDGADKEGLRRGHSMTAFTRRPKRLEGVSRLKSVVQGDGRNVDDVRRAVAGQDAVISIVSSEGRGPTTVMSDVTRAELDAMREAGVRRLVSVSVSAIEGRRPWILINMVRWILRKPYADFARMEPHRAPLSENECRASPEET